MILTVKQKEILLNKVNKKINLPILGEKIEGKIFEKGIDKILEVLEKELPDDVLSYLNDVSDGFLPANEKDQKEAMESLVELLDQEINIPLMGKRKEKAFFTIIVETIFEAMKKGNNL